MKNINDYKNGKHAIHCKTQKEWDKILRLANTESVKSKDFEEYEDIAYWVDKEDHGYSSLEFAIREGLTIHPATDFIQPRTIDETEKELEQLRNELAELRKEAQPKKKIEFVKYLSNQVMKLIDECIQPSEFETIEVLYRDETMEYDIMLAWHKATNVKCIYLGHYNDGIK